jgi:Bacterial SH3 domain./Listeria-Bacteroides repeat domain (List_Bact_rpt).
MQETNKDNKEEDRAEQEAKKDLEKQTGIEFAYSHAKYDEIKKKWEFEVQDQSGQTVFYAAAPEDFFPYLALAHHIQQPFSEVINQHTWYYGDECEVGRGNNTGRYCLTDRGWLNVVDIETTFLEKFGEYRKNYSMQDEYWIVQIYKNYCIGIEYTGNELGWQSRILPFEDLPDVLINPKRPFSAPKVPAAEQVKQEVAQQSSREGMTQLLWELLALEQLAQSIHSCIVKVNSLDTIEYKDAAAVLPAFLELAKTAKLIFDYWMRMNTQSNSDKLFAVSLSRPLFSLNKEMNILRKRLAHLNSVYKLEGTATQSRITPEGGYCAALVIIDEFFAQVRAIELLTHIHNQNKAEDNTDLKTDKTSREQMTGNHNGKLRSTSELMPVAAETAVRSPYDVVQLLPLPPVYRAQNKKNTVHAKKSILPSILLTCIIFMECFGLVVMLIPRAATYITTLIAPKYTVTFDSNRATSGNPCAQLTTKAGLAVSLPFGYGLSKEGYIFGGWNTQADGYGKDYEAGSSHIFTEDITLYAQWCIEKFVHINELNVRTSPSSEARSLTRLKQNEKILVISNNTSNPWVKIKYDGTTGYVNGTYLRDFNITEVLIGNAASGNRWLTEPSSDPYLKADNIRFLMTQVRLESLTDTIEAHFNIKIIIPYGTIKRSNNSPAGYSYTRSINIADNGIYSLGGWGNAYASSYERGKWRVEIWYANPANPANTNAMIASRSFYLK